MTKHMINNRGANYDSTYYALTDTKILYIKQACA